MTDEPVLPESERYQLHALLGRGGMACVYRATDRRNGRAVALKQLTRETASGGLTRMSALFEREFHTLSQLAHPHVIAVYDYGTLSDGSPFYTMELLDGGDLRERTPLPWQQACSLLFQVCSSLGLLHSRRLLHRDVTPRNIRCTGDGRAKLIDFGAMAHMSTGGGDVVGTPAFVAPETLHRLALDARTDLYSLGVTLYYALTGNLPYPAASFTDVLAAWGGKVLPPSAWVKDVPAALDDLVLALINPEPALRPRSAFEVMQRLAAIAGLSVRESGAASAAYLSTPTLVGRDAALERFRAQLVSARLSRGGALCIDGESGMGRSRLLNACVLEAKTLGFAVLRATASGARARLAVVSDLNRHLLEAGSLRQGARVAPELFVPEPAAAVSGEPAAPPRLRELSELSLPLPELQRAILRLWSSVSRDLPLLIAIDDAHRIDSESAAVLADLLDRSTRGRVFTLFSMDPGELGPASAALTRRAPHHVLEPLDLEQLRSLFESLFGDVPNLDMLTRELHELTGGNPGRCMALAQELIDRGLVRYEAGNWTLPRRLAVDDLPRSAAAVLEQRIAQLSPLARSLAQAQALAFEPRFRDREHRALSRGHAEATESAVAELLACGALASDGLEYFFTSKAWLEAARCSTSEREAVEHHRQLAELYRESSQVAHIYHAFASEQDELGLAALTALNAGLAKHTDHKQILEQNVAKMMQCYPRAFEAAARLGKSAHFVNELRRWQLAGSMTLEDERYPESAALWLAELERGAGLDLYRADPDVSDPMQRLMRALTGAQARFAATPEAERVYDVETAIKLLAEYVVLCIAVGVRAMDAQLLESLPPLLEPFAVLSPVLDAIWNNARATVDSNSLANYARAGERWRSVLQKLDALDGNELPYVPAIANAVAFAIGMIDAQLGLPGALALAERLDQDPYHKVSALQLRRIVRLEHGDFAGAERLRRQAEILALQTHVAPMFKALLAIELAACTKARDLSGIQQTLSQIRPIAEQHPAWGPTLLAGEASFHQVRGDLEEAERKCRQCLAQTVPDARGFSVNAAMWIQGSAVLSEVLLGQGRAEEARAVALAVLEQRRAFDCEQAVEILVALALAEASLGVPGAAARLDEAIALQNAQGTAGLRLGVVYEARARIAIWQRDAAAFERYAELTAREYRHGASSPLGARYEQLRNEALRQGLHTGASLSQFAVLGESGSTVLAADLHSTVLRELGGLEHISDRAASALSLLCSARNVQSGQLYLLRDTDLILSASRGDVPELADLHGLQAFLTRAEERSAAMEEMETGELSSDEPGEPPPEDTITLGGSRYELLMLSAVKDGTRQLAGVALLEQGPPLLDPARQSQLLSALAEQLLAR